MQGWFRSKLDHITQEFLAGGGYGAVFEAMFLAYLEGQVAHTYGAVKASEVWARWGALCAEKGTPAQSMSSHLSDREELVAALQKFQRQFEGPGKRRFQPPKAARSGGGDDVLDLFVP